MLIGLQILKNPCIPDKARAHILNLYDKQSPNFSLYLIFSHLKIRHQLQIQVYN